MKLTIKNIRARAVQAPLKRPPRSASGEIPNASLVLIDIETNEGITGSSLPVRVHAQACSSRWWRMVEALAEMIKGDALVPFEIDAKLRKRLTLQDTPGLVGQALAGIDMAAWDAYAKGLGVPLVRALGGEVKPVRAYNSCGLWIKDPALLADEASQLLAEGGYSAVKLRIGRPNFKDDLAAVRNVKKRIGDDVLLMTDFNQSLTVNEAILRGRALDDEGLYWIEEPIRHDNYAGCAKIAAEVKTPIQIGENLLNTFEYAEGDRRRSGRILHARRAAHRRGHRLDARGGYRARPQPRHVQPPVPGIQRAPAGGDADLPLAGVHGLGQCHSAAAVRGQERLCQPFRTFRAPASPGTRTRSKSISWRRMTKSREQ